jgi:uncharacterized membrane protein YeaQ/YmgE (transglycosylase-associated protein family)
MDPPWRGAEINLIIWCAIGAGLGALATMLMASSGKIQKLENLLVGVFGAFIGGEFVVDMFRSGKPDTGLSIAAIATGIAGAILMLLLLKMMRGAVGPMHHSRSPGSRRR